MVEIFLMKADRCVSKESRNKKKLTNSQKPVSANQPEAPRPHLSAEDKARIIRDRLANRPVIMFRYPSGKWNLKLIISLVLLMVALAVSLYFLSKTS
jgi:hypothetical protein